MKCKDTKNFLLGVIFLCFAFCTYAQRNSQQKSTPKFDFAKAETELVELFETLAKGENEHIRYNANERFSELLKSTLAEDGAFDYEFAQLKCEKLVPEDRKFRMFNWMVRKEKGMEFFAVMMVLSEHSRTYEIVQLLDESETIFDLPNATLDKDTWYGAYYTQVVQTQAGNRTYYTLLGWNGNDRTMNRRLIEVLSFKPNGDAVFGASIFTDFKGKKEKITRKIFEYSKKGTMILRYDFQAYGEPVGQRQPGKKQKEKLIKANMIVFDRLVPPPQSPELTGRTETYVAAGGVYDAYVWQNNRWTMKQDILARNPEVKKRKRR